MDEILKHEISALILDENKKNNNFLIFLKILVATVINL